MKSIFIGLALLVACLTGCQPALITTGPEPRPYNITRDSILTGAYLGMSIGEEATTAYRAIQGLQLTKNVTYLNVINNIYSDLSQLQHAIPLYQYILLDQKQGTDSGVQITLKDHVVTSIYLNNGQKLAWWPVTVNLNSAVRIGDTAQLLYEKLTVIRGMTSYAPKFERIFLLTKDLSTSYDQAMGQSPQWYFTYKTGVDAMDEIQVYFSQGKVSKIAINHHTPL